MSPRKTKGKTGRLESDDDSVVDCGSSQSTGCFIDLSPFKTTIKQLDTAQTKFLKTVDGQIGKMLMLIDRLKGNLTSATLRLHTASYDRHILASEELVVSLVSSSFPESLSKPLIEEICKIQLTMSDQLALASKSLEKANVQQVHTGLDETQLTLNHIQYHSNVVSQVPVFDGEILGFDNFIALFDKCVHNLEYLPIQQKWEALRSKLSGPPLALVSGCSGTFSDYHQAYTALRREYNSPFRKSMALMAQKDKLPKLSDSLASLEEFYFKLQSWVTSVQTLPTEDLSGFILFEMAFNKLPSQIKDGFCTSSLNGDNLPTVHDLLKFMSTKVQALRNVPTSTASKPFPHSTLVAKRKPFASAEKSSFRPLSPSRKVHSFAMQNLDEEEELDNPHCLNVNDQEIDSVVFRPHRPGRPSRSSGCFLCQRDHFLYRCPEWMKLDVGVRNFLVEAYKLCSRCLSDRHSVDVCPSSRSCIHCQDYHHSSLHPGDGARKNPDDESTKSKFPDRSTSRRRSSDQKFRSRSPSPSVRSVHALTHAPDFGGSTIQVSPENAAAFNSPRPNFHDQDEDQRYNRMAGTSTTVQQQVNLEPPSSLHQVFNASQKTTTGYSLNDVLYVGPKLQSDISNIVTKFREHLFVFTTDIRQMFRNIEIMPHERDLLRIIWRASPDQPIQDFCLNTVTYGTASAPYLANRVVRSLAETGINDYPLASDILSNRTYVDDCHGGGSTIKSAIEARNETIKLLSSGGFELRKWASNHPSLLADIPADHCLPVQESVDFSTEEEKSLKVLGLSWDPKLDTFHYLVFPIPEIKTKRDLASQIGRIFDPLGWLMPVAVLARSIQRSVTQAKYDWDQPLAPEIRAQWVTLASDFTQIRHLSIPRHIPSSSEQGWLVGFADASEKAYAAVVYHVSCDSTPSIVRLVLARARMAPIKQESLPRLELLGAELLSKVFQRVSPLFPHIPPQRRIAYSDSTIVLSWLTANPAPVWKVFVGNRVSTTLSNLPADCWFHVSSSDNPADIASRGALPSQIVPSVMWWSGPSWLSNSSDNWPRVKVRPDLNDPSVSTERRAKNPPLNSAIAQATSLQYEERFSNYNKLRRTTAWILRFTQNAGQPSNRRSGPLLPEELLGAEMCLVRKCQRQYFDDLLKDAALERPKLRLTRTLALFIDDAGILRVGGRLSQSSLEFQKAHPALLPKDSYLTKIIIQSAHEHLLHVGPRSTLAWIRQRFWIINGRNVIQRQLANCPKCFSIKPRPFQPEMGQLPISRTQAVPPFLHTGIDYAGPFSVSFTGNRGSKVLQIYLSVFVCFTTKAIHLEPVMDLSTDGFLQALERFVGRRGVPSQIWTDNGRNFLGAANLLRPVRQAFDTKEHREALINNTSARGINWKFIPPRAPHFGGLWEAAVKSTKRLLKVTLRGHTPSFQSFSTLIVRIEAILNSRPLAADLSSPNELRIITPGHFLAQRPLTSLPEPSNEVRHSFLSAWRFVQQSTATFWKRWQTEYLLEQQQILKWNTPANPPHIGQLVIVKEDNVPPLQWPVGVIEDLFPGQDKRTRVAVVRTPSGSKVRPLVRLCPFPDSTPGPLKAEEDVQSS
ncbi:unnamed protein product [Nesidiocoris tenuis]|uniref:Integrase catalytic domain-containing protein n=2 Tax=Nesidiocoris tenuis TaxID=355587 RepID=A0A6H5GRP3_9HEMI|nr:unnamed protein product [Nesidiocoris tenuis]